MRWRLNAPALVLLLAGARDSQAQQARLSDQDRENYYKACLSAQRTYVSEATGYMYDCDETVLSAALRERLAEARGVPKPKAIPPAATVTPSPPTALATVTRAAGVTERLSFRLPQSAQGKSEVFDFGHVARGVLAARLEFQAGISLCMCLGIHGRACVPFCGSGPTLDGSIDVTEDPATNRDGHSILIYYRPWNTERSTDVTGRLTVRYASSVDPASVAGAVPASGIRVPTPAEPQGTPPEINGAATQLGAPSPRTDHAPAPLRPVAPLHADGPIQVCVSAPRSPGGFVDTSKDVRDSIKDVERKLKGKEGLVLDCTWRPDLRVVVLGRGVGNESLGYAGGFAADSSGALGGFAERRAAGMWLAVALYAPDGRGYTKVKELVGNHGYEVSGPANLYGSLGAIGGWGDCAKKVANDVAEWITANREELISRRAP